MRSISALVCAGIACLAFQIATPGASAQPAGLRVVWSKKPVTGNVETVRVAASGGGSWVAGNVVKNPMSGVVMNPTGDVFVTRMDAEGNVLWSTVLAGSNSEVAGGLAVDEAGNAYLCGTTLSADFPLKNAYQSVFPPKEPGFLGGSSFSMAFLTKLDPQGAVVYSTLLGGGDNNSAAAVAVDRTGAAVVVGYTWSKQFPTTPDAPIRTFGKSGFGVVVYAFVTRFTPAGNALAASTLLGGQSTPCIGGSHCLPATGQTSAAAVALDQDGNAYITGATNSGDFPVTPNAVQTKCLCEYQLGNDGFVTKVSAAGGPFLYSTFLGGSRPGGEYPRTVSVDAGGAAWVAGYTASRDFPTTADALQRVHPGCVSPECGGLASAAFLSLLDPAGAKLLYSTYLGSNNSGLEAVATGANGAVWLSGTWPGESIAMLDAGRKLSFLRRLPPGMGGKSFAVDPPGMLTLAGGASALVTRLDTSANGPAYVSGVMSAAGTVYRDLVSPGELISVYGVNIGPARPLSAQLDAAGFVSTDLGGTRLYVNGVAAPLLYAGDAQINAVIPFAAPRDTNITLDLVQGNAIVATRGVRVVAAQPEAFKVGGGQFLAVSNQDGSPNTSTNPANSGDVVSLWATGGGDCAPLPADGQMISGALPRPLRAIWVEIDGAEADVYYLGLAPGTVAGVLQINVRLPAGPHYGTAEVKLRTRDYTSEAGAIWVQ